MTVLVGLACGLMMVVALAAFAWHAASSGTSGRGGHEVDALRAEVAELRQQQAEASGDELRRRS